MGRVRLEKEWRKKQRKMRGSLNRLIYGRHGFQSIDDKGPDRRLEINYFSKRNDTEDFLLRKRNEQHKKEKKKIEGVAYKK